MECEDVGVRGHLLGEIQSFNMYISAFVRVK